MKVREIVITKQQKRGAIIWRLRNGLLRYFLGYKARDLKHSPHLFL